MKYQILITKTPNDYDSNDITFLHPKHGKRGAGYQSKENGSIGLLRCPECNRENYAMAVATGCCAFCEFTVHDNVEKDNNDAING